MAAFSLLKCINYAMTHNSINNAHAHLEGWVEPSEKERIKLALNYFIDKNFGTFPVSYAFSANGFYDFIRFIDLSKMEYQYMEYPTQDELIFKIRKNSPRINGTIESIGLNLMFIFNKQEKIVDFTWCGW